ncbi:MAG: DUF262 domain-containing protein, partial [Dysgonamonadaceae bacterium]|nr:DUF262 domain-containing protein [Dysgonamonadaceae bacterium]
LSEKSRFIESVFLGVPIMPFLVSVSGEEAELEVIDGSQRIRTLIEYCDNNLKLSGLEKLTELNGTKFSELQESRKNKFLLRDFRFHVVTDKATPVVRADIFNRVNTSSNKLSPSEVRKGAYQGIFYDFILECSQIAEFREVCPIPEQKANRGEYEELILRFFAYSESYLDFKHDVTKFLDDYLIRKQKKGFDKELLKSNLISVVHFVKQHFDKPYFARKGRDNATPRVRFEAISVGAYLALQQNPNIVPQNLNWLESDEFKYHTTTDASNNQGKLQARIEFVRDCLLGLKTDLNYSND